MRNEALGMMALKTEELFDRAMTLSKNVDDTFLELAQLAQFEVSFCDFAESGVSRIKGLLRAYG